MFKLKRDVYGARVTITETGEAPTRSDDEKHENRRTLSVLWMRYTA